MDANNDFLCQIRFNSFNIINEDIRTIMRKCIEILIKNIYGYTFWKKCSPQFHISISFVSKTYFWMFILCDIILETDSISIVKVSS